MALKLDMSKTYDMVEWSFLKKNILKLGFPGRWVNLTMRCVTNVSYFVLINSEPTNVIMPTRGIRQGDPLSPYLFMICAKSLSFMIRRAELDGDLYGVKLCKCVPLILHLFFVDDSMIFSRATREESPKIKQILRAYEEASGRKVNFNKVYSHLP